MSALPGGHDVDENESLLMQLDMALGKCAALEALNTDINERWRRDRQLIDRLMHELRYWLGDKADTLLAEMRAADSMGDEA